MGVSSAGRGRGRPAENLISGIWSQNGFGQRRKNEPFQSKNPNLRLFGRFFG